MDTAALDALFASLDSADAPGAVVGVALGGHTVYRRGFGLACVQQRVPNTPATRMRIGSTTKHFASLAALLLAEEGRLDLDAPATRWLPELPTLRGVPTLRQFMTHTSGWRCGLAISLLANGLAMQPAGWNLAALTRQHDVNFAPGDDQSYCNGGYHLLSLAIERVSGMPLAAFLRTRIFEPLGLHDTALVTSDHACVPGLATSHLPAADSTWRRGLAPSEEKLGEGGMVSTVDDMLRWLAHLNGAKRVGSAESWRQMFEPARLNNGHVTAYSLGLMRHAYRGVALLHHGGAVFGGNSQMLSVPAHGLDIAIMVNGAPASANALALKIVDVLLADRLGPPLRAADGTRLRHLIGERYLSDAGRLVTFGAIDGQLAMGLQHNTPASALFESGAHIGTEPTAVHPMAFDAAELAGDGTAPATLHLHRTGRVERMQRLAARTDAMSADASLVGVYRSHDLGADAQIERDGDALVLRLRGEFSAWRRLALEPLADGVYGAMQADVLSGGSVLTIEGSARNAIQAFHLDDARAWRLRFVRV